MGDLNANRGADSYRYERTMGKYSLGIMNDNGHRLVDFCTEINPLVGGYLHTKTATKLQSLEGNYKNQIDHICFNRKWCRSIEDVCIKRGADISNDQYLVVAEVKTKIANL